ncbi:Gfo/Idh/MocA family protein [Streptomyces sp. NPDC060184]|uniref:Gfo/Idh/MocA family protein n=1 Tax=Streptomyces sp. NPDC060184 TaxID=3347064 RepID=UPI00365F60C6
MLVGAGAMGQAWAHALARHQQCELAGIVDADTRRAKGLALRLRLPRVPTAASLGELPNPAADAIVNATPPDVHHAVIAQALAAGLSVLTEKPFATDLAGAVMLTGQAGRQGRVLMVSQSRSHQPGIAAFKAAMAELGGLHTLEARFSRGYPAEGFRAELDQPLLLDMAVHAFDAARLLSGSEPEAVYCDSVRRPGTGYRGPAEAVALFEMADHSRFHYRGSWCAPAMPTAWSGSWRATGPGGTATWNGAGRVRLARAGAASMPHSLDAGADLSSDGPVAVVAEPDDAGFDRDPIRQVSVPLDHFVDALTDSSAHWGDAANNLGTVAMIEAAMISARERTRVVISPAGPVVPAIASVRGSAGGHG